MILFCCIPIDLVGFECYIYVLRNFRLQENYYLDQLMNAEFNSPIMLQLNEQSLQEEKFFTVFVVSRQATNICFSQWKMEMAINILLGISTNTKVFFPYKDFLHTVKFLYVYYVYVTICEHDYVCLHKPLANFSDLRT